MKIKYIHISDPRKEKILDTRKQQIIDEKIRSCLGSSIKRSTAEEYDRYLLEKLEKEKAEGKIIRYEIMEGKGDE